MSVKGADGAEGFKSIPSDAAPAGDAIGGAEGMSTSGWSAPAGAAPVGDAIGESKGTSSSDWSVIADGAEPSKLTPSDSAPTGDGVCETGFRVGSAVGSRVSAGAEAPSLSVDGELGARSA